MTLSELAREIGLKIRQLGIVGTLKLCARKVSKKPREWRSKKKRDDFDCKYGTDTSGIITVGSLDLSSVDAKHAVRYQTARADVFPAILRELPISYEKFTFVDLGSGKGRALLLASSFPFRAIVGVELSPSLHRIACNNIEIYRAPCQRCSNIVSVRENASNYSIPSGNVVFYLFNPFDGQVMQSVVSNIEMSLRRVARPIYILYLKAAHRALFDRSALLQVLKATDRYVIYQSNPQLPAQL